MLKIKGWLRAAALCAAFCLLLTGCSIPMPEETVQVEELLRAPRLAGDYGALQTALNAVSYTHLDVYKRQIPVPFVTSSALTQMFSNGNMLTYLDMMSGCALSRCTLFALGVTPYINASIIVQLLTVAIPSLENSRCV